MRSLLRPAERVQSSLLPQSYSKRRPIHIVATQLLCALQVLGGKRDRGEVDMMPEFGTERKHVTRVLESGFEAEASDAAELAAADVVAI